MIGALPCVKQDVGIISTEAMPGAELDLALLAGLVTPGLIGPGRDPSWLSVSSRPAPTGPGSPGICGTTGSGR